MAWLLCFFIMVILVPPDLNPSPGRHDLTLSSAFLTPTLQRLFQLFYQCLGFRNAIGNAIGVSVISFFLAMFPCNSFLLSESKISLLKHRHILARRFAFRSAPLAGVDPNSYPGAHFFGESPLTHRHAKS